MTDFTIPASKSSHGNDNRGFVAGANPGVAFGRYGAMFDAPPAQKLPQEALMALATAMIKPDIGAPITDLEPIDENPSIPAGYTYFGQFIDHDVTFDPTPFNTSSVDVSALVDFRSPALDLDNLYGRGPDDQPYMYEKDGFSFRVGRVPGHADAVTGTKADLPRLPDGTPILGDKRNDENKIVSQFHGAMLQFHNKVAADTAMLTSFGYDPTVKGSRFRTAANIVRWHYQYVVVFDYLKRVCLPGILTEVLNFGGMPRLPNYLKVDAKYAYMPIEFAGAAFRFGHSMIRPSYSLNSTVTTAKGAPPEPKTRIPTFTRDVADPTQNLNGFPGPLADAWGLDFGFFLDLPAGAKAAAGGMKVPQPSYRIDALLTGPLQDLPEFFNDTDTPAKLATLVGNLAFRNLERGQTLGLPSGQAVARLLGVLPMTDEIIWSAGSRLLDSAKLDDEAKADFKAANDARAKVFEDWGMDNECILAGNCPLWFYILREAEYYGVMHRPNDPLIGLGGQHLGPVGSRIVCETLLGLLWMDKSSFLHSNRGFTPLPQISGGQMTLASLIKYALS